MQQQVARLRRKPRHRRRNHMQLVDKGMQRLFFALQRRIPMIQRQVHRQRRPRNSGRSHSRPPVQVRHLSRQRPAFLQVASGPQLFPGAERPARFQPRGQTVVHPQPQNTAVAVQPDHNRSSGFDHRAAGDGRLRLEARQRQLDTLAVQPQDQGVAVRAAGETQQGHRRTVVPQAPSPVRITLHLKVEGQRPRGACRYQLPPLRFRAAERRNRQNRQKKQNAPHHFTHSFPARPAAS